MKNIWSCSSVVSEVWLVLANILPVLPVASLFGSISLNFCSLAAVHVVLPLTLVVPAISPDDPAIPVELVFVVLALVNVRPIKFAEAAPTTLLISLPDPVKFFLVVDVFLTVKRLDQFFLLEVSDVEGTQFLPGLDSLCVVRNTCMLTVGILVKDGLDTLLVRLLFLSPKGNSSLHICYQ